MPLLIQLKIDFPHIEMGEYLLNLRARRKRRTKIADIQSERLLGDTRPYPHQIRQSRCLLPITGMYEHRAVHSQVIIELF